MNQATICSIGVSASQPLRGRSRWLRPPGEGRRRARMVNASLDRLIADCWPPEPLEVWSAGPVDSLQDNADHIT